VSTICKPTATDLDRLAKSLDQLRGLLGKQEGKPTPLGDGVVTRSFRARFGGADVDTPVYDGEKMLAGNVISGPAIIEETTTTVVVPDAYVCSVDKYKNYVLTRS